MEVLYWQLVVLVSVVLAFAIWGRKTALFVCVGWTIWSFAMISLTPLALIQTIVAWGTWGVCRSFGRSKASIQTLNQAAAVREEDLAKSAQRIRELELALSSVDAPSRFAKTMANSATAASAPPKWRRVNGSDHIPELIKTLDSATKSVCITSGWLGAAATDRSLIDAISRALSRSVDLFLGYGWRGASGDHEPQDLTERALEALTNIRPAHPFNSNSKRLPTHSEWIAHARLGKLFVGSYPNHEKLVVKDDEYTIVGSYNWLSNLRSRNMEASIILFDSNLASTERDRISSLVITNAVLFNGERISGGNGAFGLCPKCRTAISKLPTSCGFWDDDFSGGSTWCTTCSNCGASLSTDGGVQLSAGPHTWSTKL